MGNEGGREGKESGGKEERGVRYIRGNGWASRRRRRRKERKKEKVGGGGWYRVGGEEGDGDGDEDEEGDWD